MKTFFLHAIAGAAVLVALRAPAELITYKGTAKVIFTGQDQSQAVNYKVFLTVDHDTANVAEVLYATVNGVKLYSTTVHTNLHIVEVSGANGKSYTELSSPLSSCAIDSGSTTEGIFVQGANATLATGTNSTVSFPKTLTSDNHGYATVSARLINGTTVVSFDKADTLTGNAAGESLEENLARLVAIVQNLGYTETPHASSRTAAAGARAFELSPAFRPAP